MWCEPNMKTNELSHVQRCFTLTALISICPSGQQAWIKHLEGRELGEKEDRGSPFLSRLADTPRQPFETYDDIRLTKKSRLTSCLILCFKMPLLELLRHGASLDGAYSSGVFFFFVVVFLTPAPLFSPRWPSHIKAWLRISPRKWATTSVRYAGEMIKEETDRAISGAPGPVSCCSRAGKARRLWRGNSSVREQQSAGVLQQDMQGFEHSFLVFWSRIYLWSHSRVLI